MHVTHDVFTSLKNATKIARADLAKSAIFTTVPTIVPDDTLDNSIAGIDFPESVAARQAPAPPHSSLRPLAPSNGGAPTIGEDPLWDPLLWLGCFTRVPRISA